MQEPYLIQKLARKLSAPVPACVRERAKWHVLDWTGCAIAGAREPAGKILLHARGHSISDWAFAWGGLGNILEMDDVDKRAILHPGPSIIPAALAFARDFPCGDILSAIVRGYEATIRLGRATGAKHYALWHTTGTCGAIGAAAACASLAKLDVDQTAHALALALSQSAGLWQTRHEPASMGKQLHTAHAARAGVEAARLAQLGFKSPLSILEGAQGFFAAMCPDGESSALLADYEIDWLINDVSFKPWPACRHAHAAIDAAMTARQNIDAGDIKSVLVRTYSDALKFCDKPSPKEVIDAKFSLQHAVAVTLKYGAPQLCHFAPDIITDPQIIELRSKVSVAADEQYEARYPARYGAGLSIDAGEGSDNYSAPDALGDPENPLSEDALKVKAQTLMQHAGLECEQVKALLLAVKSMSDASGVAQLAGMIEEALSL